MDPLPQLPSARLIAFVGRQDMLHPPAVAAALGKKLEELAQSGERVLLRAALTGAADLLFAEETLRRNLPLSLLLPLENEGMNEALPAGLQEAVTQLLPRVTHVEKMETISWSDGAVVLGTKLADEADLLIVLKHKSAEPDELDGLIAHAWCRARAVCVLEETGTGVETREIGPGAGDLPGVPTDEHLTAQLGPPPAPVPLPEELVRYFQECDEHASRRAPQVRRHLLNIVLANATASLAGSVSGSFPQSPWSSTYLMVLKFVCILTGLIIFGILRYRQSQNRWIELRLKAEVCRSALATWRCPRTIGLASAEDIPVLRELLQSIRYLRALHRPQGEATLAEFKADYGLHRLADQYRYFRREADKAHRVSSRFGPAYWVFSGVSLFTAFCGGMLQLAGIPLMPGTVVNYFFQFIPAIGPALASWVLAFQAIQSTGRRGARFREMEHGMRTALLDLSRSTTWEAAAQVVERAEKLLLNEVTEWYLVGKYGK